MKRIILGLGAVGAVIAPRAAAKSSGQKMSEHCKQMAGRCRQMMAGQPGEGVETAGMREHCREMAAQFRGSGEAAEEHEPREEVVAQV